MDGGVTAHLLASTPYLVQRTPTGKAAITLVEAEGAKGTSARIPPSAGSYLGKARNCSAPSRTDRKVSAPLLRVPVTDRSAVGVSCWCTRGRRLACSMWSRCRRPSIETIGSADLPTRWRWLLISDNLMLSWAFYYAYMIVYEHTPNHQNSCSSRRNWGENRTSQATAKPNSC